MSITTQSFSISGLSSLYTAPRAVDLRDCAVLFVGAYGYEDLCSRKMLRILADGLAEQGIASLRYDPLGTGNSLDETHLDREADWVADLMEAARCLGKISGASKLMVIAQGIGSLIAAQAMEDGLKVDAIAHLAPVVSGRAYLRELSMWSTLIDDGLGLRYEDRERETGSIAGLTMPRSMASFFSRAKLTDYPATHVIPHFIAYRSDRTQQLDYANALRETGILVHRVEFAGYDELMLSPTQSKVPQKLVDDLLRWVDVTAPKESAKVPAAGLPSAPVETELFHERGVAFGPDHRLIGIYTRPSEAEPKAVVIFNGSGYDRSSGWGRQVTWLSRELAAQGIASLRYDAAGVADSRPSADAPEAVLYHNSQLDDVRAAVDFAEANGSAPIVLAGRCSGAYVSLHVAARDPRVQAIVAINPVVFYWEEGRSLDEALDMRPRTLGEYRSRVFSLSIIKRVLRGEVNVAAAVGNLVKSFWQKYNAKNERYRRLRGLDGKSTFAMFDAIASRGLPLHLTYSADDAGVENFMQYFETFEDAERRYPNLKLTLLANTDHNLSSKAARQAYLQQVLKAVEEAQK